MMTFWIPALLLALLSTLALTRALARGQTTSEPAEAYQLRLYRDQLAELDRDEARGIIGAEDAGRARIEISRKILAADRALTAVGAQVVEPARVSGVAGVTVAVLMLGGAIALYIQLGTQGAGDHPIRSRDLQAEAAAQARSLRGVPPLPDADTQALMDQLRATVMQRPDDLTGLQFLVRYEAQLGNFDAAILAQRQTIAVKGTSATADDLGVLTELMVQAAGGYVSAQTRAVLDQALALDPKNGVARYYLGAFHAQSDQPDQAYEVWTKLLADSPANAPWVAIIEDQMPELAERAGRSYAAPPRGPSADDITAAGDLSEAERAQMIAGMVDGLAERLATEGGTVEDWAQLITALSVLGEAARAGEVLAEARAIFAADPAATAVLDGAAKKAGLSE